MNDFGYGIVTGVFLTFIVTRLARFVQTVLPWKRALLSGAPVPLPTIIMMRLRGCPPNFLVDAYIALTHSGYKVSMHQVEKCYLAHKHELRDHDIGEFLATVKVFLEKHPGDPARDTDGTG